MTKLNVGRGKRKQAFLHTCSENVTLVVFIRSFKNHISFLPQHSFFGIYPKEVIKDVHKGMSIRIFIAAFSRVGKIGNTCILK